MSKREHHSHGTKHRKVGKGSGRRGILVVGITLLAIAVVAAAIAILNRGSAGSLPATIAVQQADDLIRDGAFILDVRSQAEWDQSHIKGSTLIPLDQLSARLDEVPRDRDVLVVCRSGNRSQAGRSTLIQAGYTRVTSLGGGLTAWTAAGYPTEGTGP